MSLRRMMLFTLGAKITNQIQYFKARVLGNQGQFEGETCLDTILTNLDNQSLLDSASLIITPNGYKENVLYSVKPTEAGTNLLLRSEEFENSYWNKTRCTISANQEIAPNGSLTADYVVEDNTTGLRYVGVLGVPTYIGGTYTFSIFVKKKDRSNIVIQINEGGAIFPTVKFNFDSQSFTQTTPLVESSFQSVSDGWFRLIITRTPTTGTSTVFGIHPTDVNGNYGGIGDGFSRTIIWGAQLEYTPTAGVYITTTSRQIINGTIGDMDFVRATRATRVNPEGLIENVPYNIFNRSEEFENSTWSKTNVSILSNTQISPIEDLTADTLRIGVDASSVRHRLNQQPTYTTNTYTTSYYLKKANHRWVQLVYVIDSTFGLNNWANFDLENGIIGNTGVGAIATIEDVGNGWYRCSLEATSLINVTTTGCEILTTNNTNSGRYPSYKSLVTEDVCYIWGAQLVLGSEPKTYLPVSTGLNIPRIDYSDSSCPSILVEPQRTNLFTYSEEFQHSSWAWGNETFYPNTIVSPDGNLTADRIVVNSNNTTIANKTFTLTPGIVGTTYTMSVWIKSNISSFTQGFEVLPVGTHDFIRTYITTRSYTADTNWKRVTVTFTLSSASNMTATVHIRLARFFNGLGLDFSLWGAQLEVGSNDTSYIPTTTAAVTRNADVINKNNATDLIGQTEGTIFVDFDRTKVQEGLKTIVLLYSNFLTEFLTIAIGNNSLLSCTVSIVTSGNNNGRNISLIEGRNRIAVVYSLSGTKIFFNGVQLAPIANVGLPIMNVINLNNRNSGMQNGPFRTFALWKTQITDAQAINLTTL